MSMGRSVSRFGLVTMAFTGLFTSALSLAQSQSTLDAQPPDAVGKNVTGTGAGQLQEVIVTATRQAESLNRVPISVTAISQAQLDLRDITSIDDVARITPGLNVDRAATQGLANFNNISIRGIQSNVGAATTGIYIDDTPIQIRTTG